EVRRHERRGHDDRDAVGKLLAFDRVNQPGHTGSVGTLRCGALELDAGRRKPLLDAGLPPLRGRHRRPALGRARGHAATWPVVAIQPLPCSTAAIASLTNGPAPVKPL